MNNFPSDSGGSGNSGSATGTGETPADLSGGATGETPANPGSGEGLLSENLAKVILALQTRKNR